MNIENEPDVSCYNSEALQAGIMMTHSTTTIPTCTIALNNSIQENYEMYIYPEDIYQTNSGNIIDESVVDVKSVDMIFDQNFKMSMGFLKPQCRKRLSLEK